MFAQPSRLAESPLLPSTAGSTNWAFEPATEACTGCAAHPSFRGFPEQARMGTKPLEVPSLVDGTHVLDRVRW